MRFTPIPLSTRRWAKHSTRFTDGQSTSNVRTCELRDLGRASYDAAWQIQCALVDRRKRGEISDQFLIIEHPHVITMGRNGHHENLLAGEELLERAGIAYHQTNRG